MASVSGRAGVLQGNDRTDFVLFAEDVRLVHEDLEVHVRVFLVGGYDKVDHLRDGLLVQVLRK